MTKAKSAFVLLIALLALAGWSPRAHAAAPGCQDGAQTTGAVYRLCMPETWNGDLVVYAHGYVAATRPVGIPEDQFTLDEAGDVSEIVTSRGYAFAASSYRVNGLAVEEGIADLIDVVQVFTERHGRPRRVLLVGVSEGGLITALAMERHASIFHGGLAMCGPYGDFRRQVDYFGDFRVVFDVFFPGALPPGPVDIPPSLLDTWETETYTNTVQPLILDPANALTVTQLLSVTAAPFDAEDPATKERTVERLLWYNVFATNDARAKLGGQPFDNRNRQYQGSADDDALNAAVARLDADPQALATIAERYQTTGRLGGPLVALHTTGDPVIPVWHMEDYRRKIEAAGRLDLYETYSVNRYGHCSFALLEILGAFDRLVEMMNAAVPNRHFVPVLFRP